MAIMVNFNGMVLHKPGGSPDVRTPRQRRVCSYFSELDFYYRKHPNEQMDAILHAYFYGRMVSWQADSLLYLLHRLGVRP